MIRVWHRTIVEQCGPYTANRAKSHLKSILALAEEDFCVRAPSMPTGLSRARYKPKKAILTPEDIRQLIAAAKDDPEHGIYYAFPFLAGTRPSEQLGLLWNEVDFDANVIRIRRIQERDGTLTEMTKTEAGTRVIPMSPTLREILLEWRVRCPRQGKELHRVFPGPGRLQEWPKPRIGGGGPLLYQNFRKRYWEPVFKRLGLPYVTPHSARHSFISTLQAEGIEVGLVAQIAGHANPTVTLSHYTQAVRDGSAAVAALERAYAAPIGRGTHPRGCSGHAWGRRGTTGTRWHTGRPIIARPRSCRPAAPAWPGRTAPIPSCQPIDITHIIVPNGSLCFDFLLIQERPMHILVKDKRTGVEQTIKLKEAAELMGLAAEEIEWALEEFGECESEDHIATQPD